jgi:hypothetical protein
MKKFQIFFLQIFAIFLEKKNIEGNTFHFFTNWQNFPHKKMYVTHIKYFLREKVGPKSSYFKGGKWQYLNNRF